MSDVVENPEFSEYLENHTKKELRCILKVLAPQKFLSDFTFEFRRKDRKRKISHQQQVQNGNRVSQGSGNYCKIKMPVIYSSCNSCGPKKFTKCYCMAISKFVGSSYAECSGINQSLYPPERLDDTELAFVDSPNLC